MISVFSDINLLSSRIRGDEIAKYIGAKRNPKSYEGVCIFIKPRLFKKVRYGDYVDYLDGTAALFNFIKKRPKIKVIAGSQASCEYLKSVLKNEVVLIPHHHLNYEKKKRVRKEISVAGYIGSPSAIASQIYSKIGAELKNIGMDFLTCFNFRTWTDAVNFYKKIDIFVIGAWELGDGNPHKLPTKIINAASFGIPTVAFPLKGYKEMEGFYLKANNMGELIAGVNKLKDKAYYKEFSLKIMEKAEEYHIENITKLYKKLT